MREKDRETISLYSRESTGTFYWGAMNEHSFTEAVVNKLPKDVHVQSMTMASLTHTGTPDRYIDLNRDLWVEFKYAKTFGTKGYNVGEMVSERQKKWLKRRWDAGANAIVIVGVPSSDSKVARARGFVLTHPSEWEGIILPEVFIPRLRWAAELAGYILERVT